MRRIGRQKFLQTLCRCGNTRPDIDGIWIFCLRDAASGLSARKKIGNVNRWLNNVLEGREAAWFY